MNKLFGNHPTAVISLLLGFVMTFKTLGSKQWLQSKYDKADAKRKIVRLKGRYDSDRQTSDFQKSIALTRAKGFRNNPTGLEPRIAEHVARLFEKYADRYNSFVDSRLCNYANRIMEVSK